MIVGNELSDGDSFQLIRSVRLDTPHASLPIALLATQPDPILASNAMRAGATEVFRRDDLEALGEFIALYATADEAQHFGGRVLIVEDSTSHAQFVSHLCSEIGMQVDLAANVAQALEFLRTAAYQLAVIDVVLGGMDSGLTLVRRICQDRSLRLPVLVMSGFEDQSRRLLALKSGADDYISKPFTPEEFVWRVRKILESRAAAEASNTNDDALRLDARDWMGHLSPREREITQMILRGLSDKAIAQQFSISFWTVRSHIEQIFIKTGALNRRDLMSRFIDN